MNFTFKKINKVSKINEKQTGGTIGHEDHFDGTTKWIYILLNLHKQDFHIISPQWWVVGPLLKCVYPLQYSMFPTFHISSQITQFQSWCKLEIETLTGWNGEKLEPYRENEKYTFDENLTSSKSLKTFIAFYDLDSDTLVLTVSKWTQCRLF